MSAVRAGTVISHRDQLPSASRYELLVKIASGGMATVYVGRLSAAVGITRLVAIKRAHAHLLENVAFGRMLIAEAKLASRIHHPNVVAVQDVEEIEGELLLVMDYVEGASLSDLMHSGDGDDEGSGVVVAKKEEQPLPAKVVARVLLDACAGLHAAHELTDDDGKPLGIVHRDVSPHNILVGVDGVARLTDFGIAKSSAGGHTQSTGRTSTGALKGKVAYMAPEYVDSGKLDARSDVFSLGIVAWEAFTRQRLFRGATEVESLRLVLACNVPKPSTVAPWLGSALDSVLTKALARSPADRYSSAAEFAEALESAARKDDLLAKHADVAAYVKSVANDALTERRLLVRAKNPNAPASTPSLNEPKPRDERTATASIAAPRENETAPALAAPPPVSVVSRPPVDAETFGSGVSAHLVSEARRSADPERPSASKRTSPLLWTLVVIGMIGAIGAIAFFVRPLSPSSSSSSPPDPSRALSSPSQSPAAKAPDQEPPATPSSALQPSSSSSVTITATASPPPIKHRPTPYSPATHQKPALPPPPTKPTAIVVPTLPTAEPDKAPPNPYGR